MTIKEKLIKKLHEGTCSREELELLLDLLRSDDKGNYDEALQKIWQQMDKEAVLEEPLADAILQRTMEKVNAINDGKTLRVERARLKRAPTKTKRNWLIAASVAAVIVLLGGLILRLSLQTDEMIIVQTAFAEQKTVELPDQSIVQLNANSKLYCAKHWKSDKTRKVWLTGEAYFKVAKGKKEGQKFQVITSDLTVEVLGTVFNVNAREMATEVFLEEGQVNLNFVEESEDVLMQPGELVTYSKSSGKPLKKQIEKEAPASWKDGTAILENIPLEDIIQKIHEIYDVRVTINGDAYLDREFTVFLPIEDPELGFEMLTGLGIEIEKADKLWTIK